MEMVDSTKGALLEQGLLGSFLEVFSGSTITLKTCPTPGTCVPPLTFTMNGKTFYPHVTKTGLRRVKFPNFGCFLVLLFDQLLICLN